MTNMTSGEGEVVEFSESLYPTGNVEDWLGEVERTMMESVKQQCRLSVTDYAESKRTEWVLRWPGEKARRCLKVLKSIFKFFLLVAKT